VAPVNDPASWPKSSLSSRVSANAPQFMAINGPYLRLLRAWIALAANSSKATDRDRFMKELRRAGTVLCQSRPTAWNLFWAVERMLRKAEASAGSTREIAEEIVLEAKRVALEDVEANQKIGEFGSSLINDGDRVLTHCNTGTLATVSYGTALAPIRTAVRQGKKVSVIATETRPRLQGARLTAFELLMDRIPVTLIVDGAAGYVMEQGMVKLAIVGADRITSRVVANKIGTYLIALAARENQIPFYVAAPSSTFDLKRTDQLEIEERDSREVTHIGGRRVPPRGVRVFNPAFDITPIELVEGFITEKGILKPADLEGRV
jgi:methylthioribose-1-phosphate isomerase